MKVCITGSNGQLGSDIKKILIKSDKYTIIELTRDKLNLEKIKDFHCILNNLEFDILINCAAYHKTDELENNSDLAFKINSFAANELAKICKLLDKKFIHISTDYVFGGDLKKQEKIKENEIPQPINIYGLSKSFGEKLISMNNPNSYILRVASLFGSAGSSGKGGNFIETMIRLSKERDVLKVVNDQIMTPTYTYHVAIMLEKLLCKSINPEIYHCVNTDSCSWYEFTKEIFTLLNIKTKIVPCSSSEFKTVAMRPKFSALNNEKISQCLDFDIPTWRSALKEYLIEKKYL